MTPFDAAHAAMEAGGEAERLRFYDRLASVELFLLLDRPADGDRIVPRQFPLEDGPVEVTGRAWLDREWSSQPLTATQTGWDWVSLHFDSGEKLMGYRLRDEDGSAYTVGTWITLEQQAVPLKPGQLTMTAAAHSEVEGRRVPTSWDIELPDYGVTITSAAIYPQSWMGTLVPYWEGPVKITGSHPGIGYLEMSGY